MNIFGCPRNPSYRRMYPELPNSNLFCFLKDALLPSLPSDLLRWTFSYNCFYPRCESLVQSQRLTREGGSTRGDIQDTQDLASSTSSQEGGGNWAAGKPPEQRYDALGSQRRPAAWDKALCGADLGWGEVWSVGTWGTRSGKRVVKQKALAVIVGHFLA